jgi:hypothetical protein
MNDQVCTFDASHGRKLVNISSAVPVIAVFKNLTAHGAVCHVKHLGISY